MSYVSGRVYAAVVSLWMSWIRIFEDSLILELHMLLLAAMYERHDPAAVIAVQLLPTCFQIRGGRGARANLYPLLVSSRIGNLTAEA